MVSSSLRRSGDEAPRVRRRRPSASWPAATSGIGKGTPPCPRQDDLSAASLQAVRLVVFRRESWGRFRSRRRPLTRTSACPPGAEDATTRAICATNGIDQPSRGVERLEPLRSSAAKAPPATREGSRALLVACSSASPPPPPPPGERHRGPRTRGDSAWDALARAVRETRGSALAGLVRGAALTDTVERSGGRTIPPATARAGAIAPAAREVLTTLLCPPAERLARARRRADLLKRCCVWSRDIALFTFRLNVF